MRKIKIDETDERENIIFNNNAKILIFYSFDSIKIIITLNAS